MPARWHSSTSSRSVSAALACPSAAIGLLCSSRIPPDRCKPSPSSSRPRSWPSSTTPRGRARVQRDADRRPRGASVERSGQHQHADRQARQQRSNLRAVRQFWKHLPRVRGIVDLFCSRRQVGRFAGHHQQIHTHHHFTPWPSVRQYDVRMPRLVGLLLLVTAGLLAVPAWAQPVVQEYPLPAGAGPHDVAPAADGGIWFTAQAGGYLGWLDPASGQTQPDSARQEQRAARGHRRPGRSSVGHRRRSERDRTRRSAIS